MPSLVLLDKSGKKKGQIEVSDSLLTDEINEHLLYLAVIRQNANTRAGSAHTKTRSEVRGGGAKPWRQKGTGRARAGSIRSPLWRGGGITHGPRNATVWIKGMNKKERALAIIAALSAANKEAKIQIIEDMEMKEGKTKEIVGLIKALGLTDKQVLFIINSDHDKFTLIQRASRNIPKVQSISEQSLNVKDILKAHNIIISKTAIQAIEKRFKVSV